MKSDLSSTKQKDCLVFAWCFCSIKNNHSTVYSPTYLLFTYLSKCLIICPSIFNVIEKKLKVLVKVINGSGMIWGNVLHLFNLLHLAWPFTTSLNHIITLWWVFFRQTAPSTMPVHVGANSLKKPHHIVILLFSEVVKGHAKYAIIT